MFNSINELDLLNVSPKGLQHIAVVQFIFKITTWDQAQLSAIVPPKINIHWKQHIPQNFQTVS